MTDKEKVVNYEVLRVFLYKHGSSSIGIEPLKHLGGHCSFALGPVPDGFSEEAHLEYLVESHSGLAHEIFDYSEKGWLNELRNASGRIKVVLEQRRRIMTDEIKDYEHEQLVVTTTEKTMQTSLSLYCSFCCKRKGPACSSCPILKRLREIASNG